jgi:hypothetical protein
MFMHQLPTVAEPGLEDEEEPESEEKDKSGSVYSVYQAGGLLGPEQPKLKPISLWKKK